MNGCGVPKIRLTGYSRPLNLSTELTKPTQNTTQNASIIIAVLVFFIRVSCRSCLTSAQLGMPLHWSLFSRQGFICGKLKRFPSFYSASKCSEVLRSAVPRVLV